MPQQNLAKLLARREDHVLEPDYGIDHPEHAAGRVGIASEARRKSEPLVHDMLAAVRPEQGDSFLFMEPEPSGNGRKNGSEESIGRGANKVRPDLSGSEYAIPQGGQTIPIPGGEDDRRLGSGDKIILGSGDDELTVDEPIGMVVVGSGDDVIHLRAGANRVVLGSGNDLLKADGPVGMVMAGSGDDEIDVAGGGKILLGSGEDRLQAAGPIDRVYAGSGDDDVWLSVAAGHIRGGSGMDFLFLDQPLAVFDVLVEGDTVSLADRLTGDQAHFSGFESFEFRGESYTFEMLVGDFGPDAFPKISVERGTQFTTVNDFDPSVSVVWDRAAQRAVIETESSTGPTVASRAYGMVHTAIYDAWASYDGTAVRVSFDLTGNNESLEAGLVASDANKAKAMSYAAYEVLLDLFPDQKPLFDAIMTERYGLDPAGDGSLEAELGADAAADLLAQRRMDGSNQLNGYADTIGYAPVNKGPDQIVDITRWTPESVPIDSPDDSAQQSFLTPHWLTVESFALPETSGSERTEFESLEVTPPQSFFLEDFAGSDLDIDAKTIMLSAPATIDGIDYAAGDKVDVSKALIGKVIDPRFITQSQEIIDFNANLTDRQKLIAEFWEDAGGTAFPPGTFMSFAQVVSARDDNSIDEDAKMFLAMGNAMMDVGIAAWWSKVEFDYARPVRAIRELGKLGLIGELGEDELTGEQGYVIEAFAGYDPQTSISLGTRTILAENFVTYQRPFSNPSPPFAEYVSGHSSFSAAGAEVLRLFTGSEEFGASVTFDPGASQFDPTVPEVPVTLSWDTFEAASDEAGISRRYGNIHFEDADLVGRRLGEGVGAEAYAIAQQFIDGTISNTDRPFFEEWELMA